MIIANNLREGMSVEIDGTLYVVEEFQHVKRGRGGAFVRVKLKSIETSETIRKVLQPEQRIKDIFIEEKQAQYLYRQADSLHFMDMENFEERVISEKALGTKAAFLKENLGVTLRLCEARIIGIELHIFVDLKVKKASPGVKGNTVGSATKLVVLESGYSLRVPLFIKEGDVVRVDTRSGEYMGKA